jgi:predicted nucleic acid-binding protein
MWRLVDTNVVSYFVNRHTLAAVYRQHLDGFELAMAAQTWGELVAGGTGAGWGPKRWQRLHAVTASYTLLDAGRVIAEWWAEVRVVRRTQPIGVADCWIAATALAYGLELVTHNPADFAGIPGLTVVTEAP